MIKGTPSPSWKKGGYIRSPTEYKSKMQRSIAVQDLAVNYAIYLNKWLMKWCEGKEDKAKAINKVIRVLHRMGAHLLVELKLQDNVNDMVQGTEK